MKENANDSKAANKTQAAGKGIAVAVPALTGRGHADVTSYNGARSKGLHPFCT